VSIVEGMRIVKAPHSRDSAAIAPHDTGVSVEKG
jgi:hypothetical protein